MSKILYCRCAFAQAVPDGVKNDVLKSLCASKLSFETVSDLCEMSARQDPQLKAIAQAAESDTVKIAACEPRAVKWLFHAGKAPLPNQENAVEVLNMREQSAEEISHKLASDT
ncbi:MAG: hypothetical protein AAGD22_13080 [Verrucomicrobiota bacterium]